MILSKYNFVALQTIKVVFLYVMYAWFCPVVVLMCPFVFSTAADEEETEADPSKVTGLMPSLLLYSRQSQPFSKA